MIAALDALKHHPIGRLYVLELFERSDTGPGGWDVHFPDQAQAEGLRPEDLADLAAVGKASKGALGDLIIERAYARLVQRRDGVKGEATVRPGQKMAFESGAPKYLFRDVCGQSSTSS